jgi:hypothetical protein
MASSTFKLKMKIDPDKKLRQDSKGARNSDDKFFVRRLHQTLSRLYFGSR